MASDQFFNRIWNARGVARSACAAVIAVFLSFPNAHAVTGKLLPKDELAKAETAALAGDGRAALQLANHYALEEKIVESRYWNRIAIENGSPEALQTYAAKLWMSGGARNCSRALHIYEDLLTESVSASNVEFINEVRAQSGQMKKDLKQCIAQTCSRMVEEAWCD
jgi:hypothetical protein